MSALGVYLLVSLFFVLGAMLEFAVVMLIKRLEILNNEKTNPHLKTKRWNPTKPPQGRMMNETFYRTSEDLEKKTGSAPHKKSYSKTDKTDFVASLVFFISFLVFNFSYVAYFK